MAAASTVTRRQAYDKRFSFLVGTIRLIVAGLKTINNAKSGLVVMVSSQNYCTILKTNSRRYVRGAKE